MSDPQIPLSKDLSRTQPAAGGSGSERFTNRNGASGPEINPGARLPTTFAERNRGTDR